MKIILFTFILLLNYGCKKDLTHIPVECNNNKFSGVYVGEYRYFRYSNSPFVLQDTVYQDTISIISKDCLLSFSKIISRETYVTPQGKILPETNSSETNCFFKGDSLFLYLRNKDINEQIFFDARKL